MLPSSLTPFISRSLRGLAPRCASSSQSALRSSIPSSRYTHFRTAFSPSRNLSNVRCQPQSQIWTRYAGRPFSHSAPRGPRDQWERYRRFEPPGGRPQPGQPGTPWWYVYRHQLVVVGAGIGCFYVYNLETVEMTGRRRFNCVSTNQELKMGEQTYRQILQEAQGNILPDHHPLTIMVDRVLKRLIPQAPLEGADWKVHVIQDDSMMNAFVLPGGKVFVFTGIMPICRDEDGLAAVLGHEIAHVVARHSAERMSNSIVTVGLVVLISSLFDVSGQLPSLLLNIMYSLPNSRTQEAEADTIGLIMMAKACFNPEAAVKLWSRMQKAEKGTPPQFMSTHPSSYNRMEAIRERLPKAEVAFEESGCYVPHTYASGFRQAYDNLGW